MHYTFWLTFYYSIFAVRAIYAIAVPNTWVGAALCLALRAVAVTSTSLFKLISLLFQITNSLSVNVAVNMGDAMSYIY